LPIDGDVMEIVVRKARQEDREKVIWVESLATPNLSYVDAVWDLFTSDQVGEFGVAEADGEVVACGKFTMLPDGSVWLETLRVVPEYQGFGIGKRFYERFYELARSRGVPIMRMYTGLRNVVSKGLAELYGLSLAATYRGASMPCIQGKIPPSDGGFRLVLDPDRATALLMPFREKWTEFLVMNRTFFSITPTLCRFLAEKEMVYEDPTSQSVVTVGARFLPDRALNIGVFGGDVDQSLGFALEQGVERGAARLNCDFPPSAVDVQEALVEKGFSLTESDFIVMEVHLDT
jgi:GNAT superfamily N-acetyltransferase